jgi:hypothetical protein
MHNEYKDLEKRKEYLKKYKETHKEQNAIYFKKYYQRIGYKNWKKKYYLGRKQALTKGNKGEELIGKPGIGRKYELLALKILQGSIDRNKDNFHGKWDIEWNGKKIDVKSKSEIRKGGWDFVGRKDNDEPDYYLLFCVDNNKVVKLLFIPKDIFGKGCYISSMKSKYDKYIIVI